MLYLCVAVWTALWNTACMKGCEHVLKVVVFQGLKHCLCLMWFVLTSTWSRNVDSMIRVVIHVCREINRVLSLHHWAEHHQVSFCWQQVPYLLWIDIQYCRKVGRLLAGNVVLSPARDMQGVCCECCLVQRSLPWLIRGSHAMKTKKLQKNHAIGRMLSLFHGVTLTQE